MVKNEELDYSVAAEHYMGSSSYWTKYFSLQITKNYYNNFMIIHVHIVGSMTRLGDVWQVHVMSLFIGHFQVPVNLIMKARLGAKHFIWKLVLFAYEWKLIFII